MSHFETLSRVTALLFSVVLSSTGLAAQGNAFGTLKSGPRQSLTPQKGIAIRLDQRILNLNGAKNSPLLKELTRDFAQPPQMENASSLGGSSDGGGNAVGKTFFDFYENEGSIPITLDEFIALEPLAIKMIDFLNQQVPAMGYLESGGFGTEIKEALAFKKIYIVTKEIRTKSCLNKSMFSTDQQAIVACQSDRKLHIDLDHEWLEMDAVGRAGLINHELILAWARRNAKQQTKETMEEHVRELINISFAALSGSSPREPISNTVSRLFGVRTFSPKNYAIALSLKEKMKIALDGFCQKIDYDVTSLFNDLWENEFLMTDKKLVPEFLIRMKKISESARSGIDRNSLVPDQEQLCWRYRLDKTPVHQPKLKALPAVCLDRIASVANTTVNVGKSRQFFSPVEVEYYRRETLSKAISEAHRCSWSENQVKSEAIFYEALNYYRYLLGQQGIQMLFNAP